MEKNRLTFIVIVCLICGCSEVIDFPRPAHVSSLVLFATMDQNETIVHVSNTVDAKDARQPSGANDGLVKIEDTKGNIFQLLSIGEGDYVANILPEYGESYTLTVEKEGFETVQSTTTMPPRFKIESLEIQLSDSLRLDSNNIRLLYEITIELEEPSDTIEYFEVSNVFTGQLFSYVDTSEVLVEKTAQAIILPLSNANSVELESEGHFFVENENKKQILFGAEFNFKNGEYLQKVEIELKSSTLEKYDYESSVLNQIRFGNGDLVTINPLEVVTNVENGFGFFAAHHLDTISKRIPR